ncbi:hypothetical protein NL676_024096 [Syzygium grande]|nr:hypothetical protein NL676_024096 [Syzygium grande]
MSREIAPRIAHDDNLKSHAPTSSSSSAAPAPTSDMRPLPPFSARAPTSLRRPAVTGPRASTEPMEKPLLNCIAVRGHKFVAPVPGTEQRRAVTGPSQWCRSVPIMAMKIISKGRAALADADADPRRPCKRREPSDGSHSGPVCLRGLARRWASPMDAPRAFHSRNRRSSSMARLHV